MPAEKKESDQAFWCDASNLEPTRVEAGSRPRGASKKTILVTIEII